MILQSLPVYRARLRGYRIRFRTHRWRIVRKPADKVGFSLRPRSWSGGWLVAHKFRVRLLWIALLEVFDDVYI
jgi:hypothetical protein